MRITILSVLCVATFLLSACDDYSQDTSQNPSVLSIFQQSTYKVPVQVFVATQGGENIKLGLVDVGAIPYSKAVGTIKDELATLNTAEAPIVAEIRRRDKMRPIAETLDTAITTVADAGRTYLNQVKEQIGYDDPRIPQFESQFDLDKLRERIPSTFDSYADASQKITDIRDILGRAAWQGITSARDTCLEAVKTYDDSLQATFSGATDSNSGYDDLNDKNRALGNPLNFVTKLPASEITAKTDADGNCTLTLQKNERWVLVAVGHRQVTSDKDETYVWIVNAPSSDEATQSSFLLSNDNMLDAWKVPLGVR